MIDAQENSRINPIDFFRLKSSESGSRTSVGNMTRAIDSFCRFTGGADISFDSFDESLLGEWVAHQLFHGYYTKTVAYNISKIAALYNKAVGCGVAEPNDAFSIVLAKVSAPSATRFDGCNHKDAFQKLQHIIRTDYFHQPGKQLAKDMLLFALYNGGLTIKQLASFKKDDYSGDNGHVADIVNRYAEPKRKYLFPLDQSHFTARQLSRATADMLSELLSDVGLGLSSAPEYTAIDLWCAVAMECGVSASDIAVCIAPRNSANALTAFVKPSEADDEEIANIRERVITALTDNPIRWYAMHFRRNVDYGMITQRLKDTGITPIEIYYPMEEIIRMVGHRKVFENRPVISWLLFFREHVANVNRLYYEIGDLAWGYRYSRDVRSPYASISDKAVREYQDAIGVLSPDTELLPDEKVEFNEGDYLVVLGGELNGRPAVFLSKKKSSRGEEKNKIIYRIRLSGGKNINWIVDQDPRLVRKITEAQFIELNSRFQERS